MSKSCQTCNWYQINSGRVVCRRVETASRNESPPPQARYLAIYLITKFWAQLATKRQLSKIPAIHCLANKQILVFFSSCNRKDVREFVTSTFSFGSGMDYYFVYRSTTLLLSLFTMLLLFFLWPSTIVSCLGITQMITYSRSPPSHAQRHVHHTVWQHKRIRVFCACVRYVTYIHRAIIANKIIFCLDKLNEWMGNGTWT